MFGWIAQQVAPFQHTQVFALKGTAALSPASVSANPLTERVAVSQDIIRRSPFQCLVTADFVRPLFGPSARCYPSALSAPAIRHFAEIAFAPPEVLASALPDAPPISANLLAPLKCPSVKGRNYSGHRDSSHQQKSFLGRNEKAPQQSGSELRKAYGQVVNTAGVTRYTFDLFDLLFPLLKPPLRIDGAGVLDLPNELYPFQIDGIRRLVKNKCFLLADEMGTGKTVMASVALRLLFHAGKVHRALIVCPRSVLGVWDSHLRDWAATLAVTVVNGSRQVRKTDWRCPAHVYVVTYDTLRNDTTPQEHETKTLIELSNGGAAFDVVVLDEAHAVKNPRAARARAVRRLAKEAKYRWALTGTPIQNSIDDLRSLFEFLKPSLLPKAPIAISPSEVKEKIEPYFLRRRKADVFPELPSKLRSDQWLDLDDDQRREYDLALSRGRDDFRSGEKSFTRIHVFALLTKLKQICNFSPGATDSPKCAALREHIEEIVANEKKALVFSQYVREGVTKLEPLLKDYGLVLLTSDDSPQQRGKLVEQFQNHPTSRVFLATPRTGGEGLTLTAASYVIHFDHWWNPAVAWQAEDRAHRRGQRETVNVYSLWMRDTIEERIRTILDRKGLLHAEIVESLSEGEFDQALTVDDLLEVLDLDRNSVDIPTSEKASQGLGATLAEVYARLSSLDPYRFEHVVKEAFREALGYLNARVTGRTADGGVDIQATKVIDGQIERIVVQCKRTPSVGPNYARELLGVVSADPSLQRGYLVASGTFTRGCRAFSEAQSKLALVDGIQLARWICEYSIPLE